MHFPLGLAMHFLCGQEGGGRKQGTARSLATRRHKHHLESFSFDNTATTETSRFYRETSRFPWVSPDEWTRTSADLTRVQEPHKEFLLPIGRARPPLETPPGPHLAAHELKMSSVVASLSCSNRARAWEECSHLHKPGPKLAHYG
jgi:hypothetical protein